MKAVSFADDAETQPIESDLATLRGRLAHFNERLATIDDEITAAKEQVARALVEGDDEAELSAQLRDLQQDRLNLIEAAKIAEQRISERSAELKAIHNHATMREANQRWENVTAAAAQLDQALQAVEAHAARLSADLQAVRVLARDHARPEVVRTLLARYLWQQCPSLIKLATLPNGGIQYPAGGVKGRANMVELFSPDKRPYPQVNDEE